MDQSALQLTLYNWLVAELGVKHTFTIDLDADFVTGNVINGSFDGEAIDPVTFITDHDATMELLRAEIQKRLEIFKATITASRQITCVGADVGDTIAVVGPTVTGGATQPVATIATTESPSAATVIFADQNSPRPSDPYAVIRIGTISQLGQDELREIDPDTLLATTGGQRRATISVDYFGSNALENIMKASNSLEKWSLVDTFNTAGIAFIEKNDIQNLTAMLETKYQQRANFDFFIGFAENVEEDLGIIEEVELTGNVTADGKDLDIDKVTVGPIDIGS